VNVRQGHAQRCRVARHWQRLRRGPTAYTRIGFVWLRRVSADLSVIEVTHGLAAAASKGLLNLTEPGGQLVRGAVSGH
jgi:hypothetical protein